MLLVLMFSCSCYSARNMSSLIKCLRKCDVDTISLKIIEYGSWVNEGVTNDTCSPIGYYKGVYINTYVIWRKKECAILLKFIHE